MAREHDDLVGVTLVHMTTGSVATIARRKLDNTGWWLDGGGGLVDLVIERGDWRPLSIVLAERERWGIELGYGGGEANRG